MCVSVKEGAFIWPSVRLNIQPCSAFNMETNKQEEEVLVKGWREDLGLVFLTVPNDKTTPSLSPKVHRPPLSYTFSLFLFLFDSSLGSSLSIAALLLLFFRLLIERWQNNTPSLCYSVSSLSITSVCIEVMSKDARHRNAQPLVYILLFHCSVFCLLIFFFCVPLTHSPRFDCQSLAHL